MLNDGYGGSAVVTVNITVTPAPVAPLGSINLVKTGSLHDGNGIITYSFTITNTGNTPLNNITLTDELLGLRQTLTANLEPGGTAVANATYRLTQRDRERGQVTNTALVAGTTPGGITVTDTSGTIAGNNEPTVTTIIGVPLAVNDEAHTRAATPVKVPVLNNDDARQSRFNTATVRIIAGAAHGRITTNGDGTVIYTPDNEYSGEDQFTYRVQDANGILTNVATVRVTVVAGDLTIPKLFTPNGDGTNEKFEIRGLHQYAENELILFNRWGNEVYRQKNYQNTWRGDGLSEGTYYYILRIRKAGASTWESLQGYTTLLRNLQQ
ncbi:gliding motility-associated C-terminal domain-containing protein [Chitinophaga sedimenti]|uniref:T9SS type B sorting domain-containing protein n=1 Tax=Chitinophaga sedimenti TaxID=2033606 RepID=UPI0020062E21|nr:gliding motility-associated C-terminal domain-containing protein [Chitinophaga sedimenti]MCK7555553.1 gliding motility-associated C-terminal domain-containing protein [Chitinophaga sedimenti]